MISIEKKPIGPNCPPFIIAEAGINHNGDLEIARRMIKVAKEAGADAVKFQTFKADEFCGDPSQTFTYKSQGRTITESMLEMFRRYEFKGSEWRQIKDFCDQENIIFLSTPQNQSDLDLLLKLGVGAVKVGSDDFTNLPLLSSYATTKLPLIVSCGMADLSEVYQSLSTIGAFDGYPTVLLLCTSQYPTPPTDINLLKLNTLRTAFPQVVLGFSDHSQGPLASSIAVGLGACVFEKHFTLDRNYPGPDHWFSEDPESLAAWVNSIRVAHQMLGSSVVRPTKKEEEMRILARRSIIVTSNINMGDILTSSNIALKRPGNGLPSSMLKQILGMKANRSMRTGDILKLGDFHS